MKVINQPWDEPDLLPIQKMVRYHRISSRQLAVLAGISNATAAKVVDGWLPRLPIAIKIARCFHCSVEDIWGGQVPETDDLGERIES